MDAAHSHTIRVHKGLLKCEFSSQGNKTRVLKICVSVIKRSS